MPQPVLTVAQCREADRAAEAAGVSGWTLRSEEHTSELQSH